MTGKLSGRRALITGGSSGIGKATAQLFAQEGASIAIVNRNREKGMAFVEEMRALGNIAVFIQADVSREGDCSLAVEKTIETLGGLDILFNNAGIVQPGNVSNITEEKWDETMAVNVKSIFLMCKFAVPYLAKSPYDGVIVNMGSALSLAGSRNMLAYAASKAAVLSMTKSMALDLCRQNIRVTCICPGDTETPSLLEEANQAEIPYQDFVASSKARRPLGRIGAPEDIARGVLYLASDDGRYITGVPLVIDGGGLTAYGWS
ncbi:MAG: SDR family NAD(P)-dependent oxidoreductase [Anaerolineaceae bacterium]|nr:SDR family NAD(P)-dependent oxidoreductase [Anaerolineaceae bacterium]